MGFSTTSNDQNSSEDFVLVAGGPVDRTSVCLSIYGEDLIPEEISQLLCCKATQYVRRGERRSPKASPYARSAWIFEQEGEAPVTAEELIRNILSYVSADSVLWRELSSKYEVQLRIAIHMENWNKGFDLSSELVQQIAKLGVNMVFDIYAYVDDDVDEALDELLSQQTEA